MEPSFPAPTFKYFHLVCSETSLEIYQEFCTTILKKIASVNDDSRNQELGVTLHYAPCGSLSFNYVMIIIKEKKWKVGLFVIVAEKLRKQSVWGYYNWEIHKKSLAGLPFFLFLKIVSAMVTAGVPCVMV